MKEALLVIDYSCDFVAPDGALSCQAPGQAIEGAIERALVEAYDKGSLIVFAMDLHELEDPYHPESALFPPHNLKGTPGRALYGAINPWYAAHFRDPRVLWLDKRRYSAFCGTPLDLLLRERGVEKVVLCGVCTDICILHTAVDAYQLGYAIEVPEHAVASFDPAGHAFALAHFKNVLGAKLR
ncbi:Nicotinamidase [Clostridiaceae bacterium JG1575]|nr:Nicotinamidase [Clostridiaceae bacterium JG1575]